MRNNKRTISILLLGIFLSLATVWQPVNADSLSTLMVEQADSILVNKVSTTALSGTTINVIANVSNKTPVQNSTVYVTVTGPATGAVKLLCHYKSTDTTYTGTIDLNGKVVIPVKIGRATIGYTTDIVVSVTYNGKIYTTKTSFTPTGTSDVLPIPTSVKAVSASYNSIKTSWTAVNGASGYEVYRATSSTGTYSKISTPTSTSYTNTSLATGTTYYYKVRAYKTEGTTKTYSNYSAVASAKPALSAPVSVKAASYSYNILSTSWSKVSGASGYEVYRATSTAGTYAKISTTTAAYYYNTGLTTNKTYYYKVRAYRTVGTKKIYGSYSSVASAKPIPAAPSNLKATRIDSKNIRLTWIGVTGANGYEVSRATSRTGTYTYIAKTTNQYYVNSNLVKGKTYYYKIRSYRTVGKTKVYSGWTSVVYAKP